MATYGSGVNRHYPLEELVEQAERWVAAGFGAVKVKVGRPDLDEDLARLAAVRRVIGDRRGLMAEWMRANHAFHDVLYRVADMPYVESIAKGARRTFSGPAVWAPVDEELDRLYERNQAEHRAIRQALAAGSVAGARELAHEHVMHSFTLLTSILEHVGADWAARTR